MLTLKFILFTVFLILSILHFYWASGGKWALADSLPTNPSGELQLKPNSLATIVVALGLLGFGLFYLNQTAWLNLPLPNWFYQLGRYGIPAIFLLRAIGDFKYAGFFKSIKETAFAKKDSRIYSPLCLLLALMGAVIVIWA